MSPRHKQLIFAPGTKNVLQTPPLSVDVRERAGYVLRQVQAGNNPDRDKVREYKSLASTIGPGCYQLSLDDNELSKSWRVIYWIGPNAIYILEVYEKRQQTTPNAVKNLCKNRLKAIQQAISTEKNHD